MTIKQILEAKDRTVEKVPCPEWGGDVYVRTIDGNTRDAIEEKYLNGESSMVGVRAAFLAAAICDPEGKLLKPSEAEIQALGKKSAGPLDRCCEVIKRISAISQKDIDELEKNCEATSGDS